MPSTVVRMKPEGLFGPGAMNFAMMPAMKPMMTTQSMPMTTLPRVTTLAMMSCAQMRTLAAVKAT